MLEDLVIKNRSYRRFYENEKVTEDTLKKLVDLARLTASAANLQPLKYILSFDSEKNDLIFPNLTWAGYLKDWKGPKVGERPSSYIIVLGDKRITNSFGCDHGIAAQTILLGATERELGGCMLACIKREKLRESLNIADRFEILLVIAIGKPKEKVVIDKIGESSNIKYFRDTKGVHHVPKRSLNEVIIS